MNDLAISLLLQSIIDKLGPAASAGLSHDLWEDSESTLPKGEIEWLNESLIREACDYIGFPVEIVDALVTEANRIACDPLARALAWHAHRLAYVHDHGFGAMPNLLSLLKRDQGTFAMLVALSGYRRMRKVHAQRGIPDHAIRAILNDIPPRVIRYHEKRGVFGLVMAHAGGWFQNHFRGDIYRIGRLQYILRPFGDRFAVFRHQSSGRVVVLAGNTLTCRQDGYADGAAGNTDPNPWNPALHIDDDTIRGHPVDPVTSRVAREPVTWPAAEWQRALEPDDHMLEIHIPSDGRMDYEACGQSNADALTFFDRHFPERPARGVMCTSWIMDPQLAEYLSPDANMPRHLAEYYLLTTRGSNESVLRFVFHFDPDEPVDTSALPRTNSLHRAILDHLAAGREWRNTRGFILREDLNWGSRAYRSD